MHMSSPGTVSGAGHTDLNAIIVPFLKELKKEKANKQNFSGTPPATLKAA